jgi:hypothetical protein
MAEDPSRTVYQKMPTAPYSPTPGCIIFVIGGTAIIVLIAWFLYAGFKQAKEIASFTDSKPAKFESAADASAKLPAIHQRLTDYAKAIEQKQSATVSLSLEDLNVLLTADPTLASIKENVRMESIGERAIANISFPLNGIREQRYLNGKIEFTPVVKPSSGLTVQTETVSVPGKSVSDGFINLYKEMHYLDDMLLKAFREHPVTGPPLKNTTTASLKDGSVVLTYEPKAAPNK